jgi:hypothetical protein
MTSIRIPFGKVYVTDNAGHFAFDLLGYNCTFDKRGLSILAALINRYRLIGSIKPIRFSPSHLELLCDIHIRRGMLHYYPRNRRERMLCDELEAMGYIVRGAYQHRYLTDRGVRKIKSKVNR